MSTQSELQRIVDLAVALPDDQLAAYLDRGCAGDATLRHEIESLMRSLARTVRFLAAPAADAAGRINAFATLDKPSSSDATPIPMHDDDSLHAINQCHVAQQSS